MTDDTFAPFERDTPDLMDTVRHIAEGHAEELARGSFVPALMFMDDDEAPRAIVFPEIDGKDDTKSKLAWTMRILSAAIDDLWSIAFVVDTYHTTSKKHDGSDWGPNEMGYAFENKTVDADLVTEALTYQMVAGDRFYITTVPYKRDNGEIEFLWDEVITLDEDDDKKFGGFYPNALRDAYAAPKIMAIPEAAKMAEALGLDLDAARLHSLCAAVKIVLTNVGIPALIPCRTEEEAEIVSRSFSDLPGVNVLNKTQVEEIVELERTFRLHSDDD